MEGYGCIIMKMNYFACLLVGRVHPLLPGDFFVAAEPQGVLVFLFRVDRFGPRDTPPWGEPPPPARPPLSPAVTCANRSWGSGCDAPKQVRGVGLGAAAAACRQDNTALVWVAATGEVRLTLRHPAAVAAVAASGSGTTCVTGCGPEGPSLPFGSEQHATCFT